MKDKQLAVSRRKLIRYSAADKIKVAKLFVEEDHQAKQLAKEFRISESLTDPKLIIFYYSSANQSCRT